MSSECSATIPEVLVNQYGPLSSEAASDVLTTGVCSGQLGILAGEPLLPDRGVTAAQSPLQMSLHVSAAVLQCLLKFLLHAQTDACFGNISLLHQSLELDDY